MDNIGISTINGPLDYEQYLAAQLSQIEKEASFKHLLLFPKDEIEISEHVRKTTTVEPLKPEFELAT